MPLQKIRDEVLKRPYLAWIPFLVWVAVVFTLASRSSPPGASEVVPLFGGHGGKVVHFLEYATGGLLAFLALYITSPKGHRVLRALLAWLIIVIVAYLDEIVQSFTPGRDASAGDVLIDISGAATALVLVTVILWADKALRKKKKG